MNNGSSHQPTFDEAHETMRTVGVYESESKEALGRFYDRTGFEPAEHRTPLDELLGRSWDEFDELTDDQLGDWLQKRGVEIELPRADMIELCHAFLTERRDTIKRFAHFCSQNGLLPYDVMRNVYAAFGQMELEPWANLTVREKGLILGESHGSSHFRVHAMCVNLLRRKGIKGYKARAQKGQGASAKAAAAQKGNTNRKRKPRSRHRRTKKHQEKIK